MIEALRQRYNELIASAAALRKTRDKKAPLYLRVQHAADVTAFYSRASIYEALARDVDDLDDVARVAAWLDARRLQLTDERKPRDAGTPLDAYSKLLLNEVQFARDLLTTAGK